MAIRRIELHIPCCTFHPLGRLMVRRVICRNVCASVTEKYRNDILCRPAFFIISPIRYKAPISSPRQRSHRRLQVSKQTVRVTTQQHNESVYEFSGGISRSSLTAPNASSDSLTNSFIFGPEVPWKALPQRCVDSVTELLQSGFLYTYSFICDLKKVRRRWKTTQHDGSYT